MVFCPSMHVNFHISMVFVIIGETIIFATFVEYIFGSNEVENYFSTAPRMGSTWLFKKKKKKNRPVSYFCFYK